MAFNLTKMQWALLIALLMLPLSGTLIHLHVHPQIEWLLYLTLFDTVAITLLFLHDKLRIYGFWLNTLIGMSGIIYHAQFNLIGTLSDSFLIVADVLIGYSLLMAFETKVTKTKRRNK